MSRTTRLALAALTAGSLAIAANAAPAAAQDEAAQAPNLEHPIASAEDGAPPLQVGGRAITGGRGDRVTGGGGSDVIRSLRGNDRVNGGRGDDALFGGAGDDRLRGGSGDDLIVDTKGADRVAGDGTRERVAGGPGDDRVNVRDGRSGDRVSCGPGFDAVVADRGDRVASDCEVVLNGRVTLVRRNAKDMTAAARRDFVAAVKRLKHTPSPYDPAINWYDQFVVWHDEAFAHAAHGSPAFLPWHREFLRLFEGALQTVSGKPIALPYWDWTDQASTDAVFSDTLLGPDGDPDEGGAVTSGPFRRGAWRVWVRDPEGVQPLNPDAGEVGLEPRWITRAMGSFDGVRLPTSADVDVLLGVSAYDAEAWDGAVAGVRSFRNALEGWDTPRDEMGSHNSVHVWVGGEDGTMGKTTSPNDPVFWLHHNNVDRVWEQWSRRNGHVYLPSEGGPDGGNLHDAMAPFRNVGIRAVPAQLLRTEALGYAFDDLPADRVSAQGAPAQAAVPTATAAGTGVSFTPAGGAARAGLLCVLPPRDARS